MTNKQASKQAADQQVVRVVRSALDASPPKKLKLIVASDTQGDNSDRIHDAAEEGEVVDPIDLLAQGLLVGVAASVDPRGGAL